MTQPRGVNFYGLERILVSDLNAMQDRLFREGQRRAASLFSNNRATQSTSVNAQAGVLSGLKVTVQSGMTITVSDGEGYVYDPSATGDEASYRVLRVDLAEGIPFAGPTKTLSAADPTNARIDAITLTPLAEALAGDSMSVYVKAASSGQIASQTKGKRTRASAQINVIAGTPAVWPQATPAIPSGHVLLAYVYVPAAASTPSFVSDQRSFLVPSNLKALHGVLEGAQLSCDGTYATKLWIGSGMLAFHGECVELGPPINGPWALLDVTQAWEDSRVSGYNAAGWKYVYAMRKGRTTGNWQAALSAIGSGPSEVEFIVSQWDPLNNGDSVFQLRPGVNPVVGSVGTDPGGVTGQGGLVYLGSFYWDGATILPFRRVGNMVLFRNRQQVVTNAQVTLASGTTLIGSAMTAFQPKAPVTATAALLEAEVIQAVPPAGSGGIWGRIRFYFDGATNALNPYGECDSFCTPSGGAGALNVNASTQIIAPMVGLNCHYIMTASTIGAAPGAGVITQANVYSWGYFEDVRTIRSN